MPNRLPNKGGTIYREFLQQVRTGGTLLTQQDIAKALDVSPGFISLIFQGKVKCPESDNGRMVRKLTEVLFANDLDRRERFATAIYESNRRLSSPGISPLTIRRMDYGHLGDADVSRPGLPSLSGPAGFLIDCFDRMTKFTGQAELKTRLERVTLQQIFRSAVSPADIMLCHLAALNMMKTSYFFCIPVSLGIGGLAYVKRLPARDIAGTVSRIRNTVFGSTEPPFVDFRPVCMKKEIGYYFAKTMPSGVATHTTVTELSAENCSRALRLAARSKDHHVPVLFVDELTCYLTLGQMRHECALLFERDSPLPRFYFGFSVTRDNRDLRKELERASELYLQSDALYIARRYVKMYKELVRFAKQLKDCSGSTWISAEPEVWAKQVAGIDPLCDASSLISRAWIPILRQVAEMV